MSKVNYQEAKQAIYVITKSGSVPFLVGHAGIGKTQMANNFARFYSEVEGVKTKVIEINGGILSEGELTGIPYNVNKVTKENKKYTEMRYSTFHKFIEAFKCIENDVVPIIFIDELNRTDQTVHNNLMSLILEKRLGSVIFPEDTIIIAAGNPDDDDVNDYQVQSMNHALINRFVFLELESDIKSWLEWATNAGIHKNIIEFLSAHDEYFHMPHNENKIKPTPRGWEKLSNNLKTIDNVIEGKEDIERMTYIIADGIVGSEVTAAFISYLNSNKDPLLTGKDFFEVNDNKLKENLKYLSKENNLRQNLSVMSCVKYLDEFTKKGKKLEERHKDIFTKCIKTISKDLGYGISCSIKNDYPELIFEHELINDEFLDEWLTNTMATN